MDQNQHENHSHHSEHSHHSHHSHHKHHSKHKSQNSNKNKFSLSIRKSALVFSVIALVLSRTAVVGAIVLQSSVYGLKYNAENYCRLR